jgi:hypothetical protein
LYSTVYVVDLQSFASAMSGTQENRQLRLEGDKEMYARRLQLERVEAEQKAAEANKRCALDKTQTCCLLPCLKQHIRAVAVAVFAVCVGLCKGKPY